MKTRIKIVEYKGKTKYIPQHKFLFWWRMFKYERVENGDIWVYTVQYNTLEEAEKYLKDKLATEEVLGYVDYPISKGG